MKRKNKANRWRQILPLNTIDAAIHGDRVAIGEVLEYYEPYIRTLATVKLYDASGCCYSFVDEDMQQLLRIKLDRELRHFEIR